MDDQAKDAMMPSNVQAVNRDCARFLRDRRGAAWLNREQDMGSPGLRQAKLSYHPDLLLQEHLLIPRG
jgi:hypothetical protein